jgi:hypothetical protein
VALFDNRTDEMKNMTGFGNAFVLPLVCLARIEKPRGKKGLTAARCEDIRLRESCSTRYTFHRELEYPPCVLFVGRLTRLPAGSGAALFEFFLRHVFLLYNTVPRRACRAIPTK